MSSKHTKMVAIIFTKEEQNIFEEYRDTFGFGNSADAYRGLLELVDEKWTGIQLKNDRRFSLRLTMEDYNELDRIRERLGGISRSETLRRGVNFLHGVIATGEFPKWQEFAAKVPRYERTGKRKENGLASGKMVIYSMNDLSLSVLQEVGKAFGEDRTGVLRLALEAAKVLPPEALATPEEEKFHSTVRLRADEYEKLEALKQRLNYNANGIFRTGIFLAKRELREYRMNRKSKSNPISIHSDLWDNQVFSPVYNVRQTVIMQP